MTSAATFEIADQRLAMTPIRGRADELKEIGAHVNALTQGGVVAYSSSRVAAGIGKSRLLTELLALADKAGVRTLFGEAFEYQRAVPFFSLFMATLRAEPPVGDIEALGRLGSSADLSYWVVHHLQDAIHAAAAQTPLAIVLEDIHWADNGTLLALRSLATARIGCAGAVGADHPDRGRRARRAGDVGDAAPANATFVRSPRCRRLRSPRWFRTRCGRKPTNRF